MKMEQISHWIIELNRSNHTAFAIFTVIVMVGLGCLLAGLLEIILSVIGIKADKKEDLPQ